MKNPLVSIIVITRNRPTLLRYCLEHILAQPYPYKEIVVVDSSSNDESEQVVADHSEVISIRLHGQRNNMPQARNAGMAVSSGEIIIFVDDDAMVEPGWLEACMNTYQDETVGAVGGRIIEMPKPHCDLIVGTPNLTVRPSGRIYMDHRGSFSSEQVEVDWLSGGNVAFRRKVLEQVGGFDPTYTLINTREDVDFSFRVKRAGWRVVFNPAMAVVHYSLRTSSPRFQRRLLTQFSNARNSTYFTIKHFGFNPYTLTSQLLVAPARDWGLAAYHAVLHNFNALAQTIGRIVGLGVGIRWLISSRRRAQAAPKIWQSDHASDVQLPQTDPHKGEFVFEKVYSTSGRKGVQ